MKTFTKHILLLALMLFGVAGAAWAQQQEKLLTTVTATGQNTYSQSPDGIVTVTLVNTYEYYGDWGWMSGSVTVEASQGYTITRCVFKQNPSGNPNRVLEDDLAPFTATIDENDYHLYAATSTGDVIGGSFMDGVSSIEVYGYEPDPYAPALDETTGHWNFLMPGSNKVVNVNYYDSVLIGANVAVQCSTGCSNIAYGYRNADGDTILYFENSPILTLTANAPEGKAFDGWTDGNTDNPRMVNLEGDTAFLPIFYTPHTLTLNQADGGTLTLDGVTLSGDYTLTLTCGNNSYTINNYTGDEITLTESLVQQELGAQYFSNASNTNSSNDYMWVPMIGMNEDAVLHIHNIFTTSSLTYSYGGKVSTYVTISATCTPNFTLPAGVLSVNADGSFNVKSGTELTLVATPDSAHYLSAIDGHDTVGNYATGYSFTMPDEDTELAATFAAKPTLTLASNDIDQGLLLIRNERPFSSLSIGDTLRPGDYITGISSILFQGNVLYNGEIHAFYNNGYGCGNVLLDYNCELSFFNGSYILRPAIDADHPGNAWVVYNITGSDLILSSTIASSQPIVNNVTASTPVGPGTDVTIVALPADNHHLQSWSNGYNSTSTTQSITMGTADSSITAIFDHNPFQVAARANRAVGGTVSAQYSDYPDGTAATEAAAASISFVANPHLPITLTATPAEGFHFTCWTSATGDTLGTGITLSVTDDADVVAVFDINTYTVTLAANNGQMGSVAIESVVAPANNIGDITLYENNQTTSINTPTYTASYYNFTRSQYIIPAADLADIPAGTSITGLKYYLRKQGTTFPVTTPVPVDVYMAEVESATYTSSSPYPIAKETSTMVHQGTLSVGDAGEQGEMTIEFSQPYIYNGGDLVIGMENSEKSNTGIAPLSFYSTNFSGVRCMVYGSNSTYENLGKNWVNYRPMTTLSYVGNSVTDNGDGTYTVAHGTQLTLKATPDPAHYLANFDSTDVRNDNDTATKVYTITSDLTATANFQAKPTLTLTQTDGGTLEAIVPEGVGEETLLTTVTATGQTTYDETTPGIVTVSLDNLTGYNYIWGWLYSGSVTVEAAQGYTITRCVFRQNPSSTPNRVLVDDLAPFTATMVGNNEGGTDVSATTTHGDEIGDDFMAGISSIEVYGYQNVAANVTPIANTNTYIIDYGTPVTVVATPDAQHYLVRFSDDDNDTNSNTAVEKTYDSVIAPFTLTANFQAKPTLTLTHNDGGTMSVLPGDGIIDASARIYTLTFTGFNNGNMNTSVQVNASEFPVTLTHINGNEIGGDNLWNDFAWVNSADASNDDGKMNCSVYNDYHNFRITISGAFDGTANIHVDGANGDWGGEARDISVSCVLTTNDIAYIVDYGTEVTVTATPDATHYLATLGGVTMGSNTAKDTTFALTATTNLEANFTPKPTLTLAHNDGGEMEIVPEEVMAVNEFTIPSSWNNDNTLAAATDLPSDFQSVSEAEARAWQNTTGHPVYLFFKAYASGTVAYVRFNADGTVADVSTGLKSVIYNNVSDVYEGYLVRYTTVGAASNFIASTAEPNTYYIDYNTSVTVKATPSDTAYLVRFDQDDDTNSNTAVEKTYGPLTAALTTATATFNAKPVLTLAQNESWGSVTVEGYSPAGLGTEQWNNIPSEWSGNYSDFTVTEMPNDFQGVSEAVARTWQNTTGKNVYLIFKANETFAVGLIFYANGTLNETSGAISKNMAANAAANGKLVLYTTGIHTEVLPAGVVSANATADTFVVDYGTTLTVTADATDLHHVANWEDQNGDSLQVATYSAYFITEPEMLFPDSSSLTFTVTTDTVARAMFGLNYRHLTFSHNEGGHMEFVIDYDSVSFANIETTSVESGNISIQAGQADEDGMYLKANESSVTIAVAGGAVITQVDFHVTNGTNLVNTISTNAEGATISTTNNNEYGSIRGLNATELTISSSTTFDLQIDQFIVHYGNALPNGVAVGPNDSTWYVMPDTTVIVRAIPEEGHYLRSWASTPDQTDSVDALTVSLTVTTDDTLTATFAPNPVIELAVSDAAMGSVYFTDYQGNTVTRAGIIQAQSVALPYRWYEANEIMSIEGGDGMLEKDATSHYLTVNGIFEGTAMVVTSNGAFSVTCEPTLPNGVHYNVADGNYTVLPYTNLSFTATTVSGDYYLVDWAKVTENDSILFDAGMATTTVNIDDDMKILVNFLHNPYTLTLVADTVMGRFDTVAGQEYVKLNADSTAYIVMADSTVAVVAEPKTGYHITSWSNNDGTADSASILMTMDSTITVTFDTNVYSVSYVVDKDTRAAIGTNQRMGTVTLKGRHMHFLNDTLTVRAKYGYTFKGWYNRTKCMSTLDTFVFSPVKDTAFRAKFNVNNYYVSGEAIDTAAGYVTGSDTIAYRESLTLKAVAKTGYHFVNWQDTAGNVLGSVDSLTVQALGDSLVYATFDTNSYNLVVNVAEASTGFGTVAGDTTAKHFVEYQISATADSGYHFVMWTDSVENNPRTVTLTSDSTFTAVFDTNEYHLAVVVDSNCTGRGTVAGDTIAKHFLSYEISATANPGFHFVMWNDSVTTATRTVEPYSDSTFSAIFDYNPALTLVYDKTLGNVNFVVESQSETFTGITDTSLSAGGITVTADSADASGISLKNGKTLTIVADGDNVITQVAFHLTNGANKASSITADHGTVNANDGDAYGAIVEVNSDTLVISSTSTKNINIDQLTIQYAPALPAGVVHLDEDSANVYRVDRNTVVSVNAFPGEGKYLVSWAGDTTSTDDLTAVVTVADSDLTVIANFKNNPVLTFAANGHGRVYFEGYEGYTVNRDEAIQATNLTEFPYTWLESGTISEINGGDGMVVKDNTNHYVSVYGPFDGTATVVTTSGSFTVTCIPTVPNGITVVSDGIYTFEPGTTVSIKAEPDAEHYLVNWNDLDSAALERTIVVTDDTNLVANFLHFPYTLTFTADTVMGAYNVVDSVAFVTLNADTTYTVMADSVVTIGAVARTGYHFVMWTEADTLYSDIADTTVLANADRSFVAVFDTNAYSVAIAVADACAGMGTVDTTPDTVKHFLSATYIAVADSGFRFTGWKNVSDSVVSLLDTLVMEPVSDTVLYATFDTIRAELAWSADTFTCYTLIDPNNWRPTLANPHGVEVRYGCVEGSVPTDGGIPVVDTTGAVGVQTSYGFIPTTVGTYHIYAVHDLTQDYFYDSVVYVLNVERGAIVVLSQSIAEGGLAKFVDQDSAATLTHYYADSIMAYVAHDDSVAVVAKADTGYHFNGWQTGNLIAGYTYVSADTLFTYIVPDTMATGLKAVFDTNEYVMNIAVAAANSGMGTVTGPDTVKHFLSGTYVATADTGYHFTGWVNEADSVVSMKDTLVVAPVSDTTLYATFDTNTYVLTVLAADSTMGSVAGSDTVKHFVDYTISATPATCYEFVAWSDGDSTATRTVTLTSDSTITAEFAYTVRESYDTIDVCDTLLWNDSTYALSGDYSKLLQTAEGCDSTAYLHLTVRYSTYSVLDTTVCERFTWNNVDYFRSTDAHFDTTNAVGCDSIAYLQLTVNYASESNDTVVTCDSVYEWNGFIYTTSTIGIYHTTNQYGCDSTASLYLTLNNNYAGVDVRQACDSLTWVDGVTYYESVDTPTYVYQVQVGDIVCDSTVTLNLTISSNMSSTDVVSACDSMTWIDGVTYSEVPAEAPVYVYHLTSGCDSTVTLELTLNSSIDTAIYDTACTYYIWDGTYYTSSGNYTKRYQTIHGCDSVVTLHLVVNYPTTAQVSETACGSYIWNDIEYSASGAYTQTLVGSNGCDSTVTLALTIKQSVTTTKTVTACDSYTWHDSTYTVTPAVAPTYTTTGGNGCDSTVVLMLTIATSGSSEETVTACDSYTWHDSTYTETPSVAPTYVVTGDNCSTVVTLNLTINHSVENSFDTAACNYFIWEGSYFDQSGSYTKNLDAVNGCDSTVTMTLTINQPVATSFYDTACVSYTWNEVDYTASGAYTQNFSDVNGCDSTVTLRLTIKQPASTAISTVACDSYEWNDSTYTEGGAYRQTFVAANGCDSVVTLTLTVNQSTTGSETVTTCGSYTWHDSIYTESGVYTYHTTNIAGCDSTVTLTLTIDGIVETSFEDSACVSYSWNDSVYTESGVYRQTFEAVNQCDSIVTLTLTVNQPTAASLTVTACDSYSWHDVTYTETPAVAPTYTTTGSNGCDSVTTLYLTVNYSTSNSENVTACVSYEWNNTEYTVSGVYTFDTVNAMGCDSVATLNLTINQPDSETVTVRACDSYEWNNVEYTVSGVYTFRTTTVAGCDSTATLNLTVNYSADTTLSMIGEGSIVWNEETFYASGTYERVIETVEGCDSNVTLNLIVLPDGFVMPYLYNVMDVVLSINHNEPGHENLHYIYYRWYRNDELVLEGANVDSYSEGGQRLNGCYYLEVAVDESMEYWVRSNTVCIGEIGIDKAEELTFTLAPNPVVYGSIVTVSVNADNADLQGAEIRVYDVNGHEILTQKDDVTIVAEMPSGVYLVRLTLSDGRTGVKRLIVR